MLTHHALEMLKRYTDSFQRCVGLKCLVVQRLFHVPAKYGDLQIDFTSFQKPPLGVPSRGKLRKKIVDSVANIIARIIPVG